MYFLMTLRTPKRFDLLRYGKFGGRCAQARRLQHTYCSTSIADNRTINSSSNSIRVFAIHRIMLGWKTYTRY